MTDMKPAAADARMSAHRPFDETGSSALATVVDSDDASGSITGVADTAFWTAGIRAREQQRSLPVYRDVYATHLAGARGMQIAHRLRGMPGVEWGVSMRSVIIDRLILEALSQGVDAIVSLGAGLDARPYRLDIPSYVLWVEVDLPEIIEYKNARTADCNPRCALLRIAADLVLAQARGRALSLIGQDKRRVLVLAEGLLPYLTAEEVAAIAGDLHGISNVIRWIVEFDMAGAGWAVGYRKLLRAAPRRFQMPNLLAFLQFSGWESETQVGCGEEATRLGRPLPLGLPRRLLWSLLPAHWKAQIENLSGVALLKKM